MGVYRDKKIIEGVKAVYGQIAKEFDVTRKYSWQEFGLLRKYCEEGEFLLDVGCGNGRLVDYLRSNGYRGRYLGVDNVEELLSLARGNYPEESFECGDLTGLSLEDGVVDVVAAVASFHHLPSVESRRQSLKELARVLRNDGVLYLTVWNLVGQKKYRKYLRKAFWKSLFSSLKMRDTFIPWGDGKKMRYYYAFKIDEIEDLLVEAGFDILEKVIGNNFAFVCRKKAV